MLDRDGGRRARRALGLRLPALMLLFVFGLFLPHRAAAQVTVSGTVTTSSGSGVAGAQLQFSNASANHSTTAGSGGRYSIALPTGTYSLEVTPPEGSQLVRQSQSGIAVTANKTLDVVLIDVGPATYAGTLRDSRGTAIIGARVTVRDADFTYSATTNANGSFSIAATTAASSRSVRCESHDGCSHFGAEAYASLDLPAVDLSKGSILAASLTWPVRTLSGTVKRSGGAAVSGATVSWSGSGYTGEEEWKSDHRWRQRSEVTTQASGQFTLLVGPGEGTLSVHAPEGIGLANASRSVTIPAEPQNPAAQEIVLPAAPTFAGKLIDSAGVRIANATVTVSDGQFSYSGTTNGSGQFSFLASSSATSVSARCESYNECSHFGADAYGRLSVPPVDLSHGSVTNASLVWPIRKLTGSVRTAGNAPVVGAEVGWSGSGDQGTEQSPSEHSWSNSSSVTTNASGQFTLFVAPGEGTLSVLAPEGSGLSNKLELVTIAKDGGNPPARTITLATAPLFSGKLVDGRGAPIANARVSVRDDNFGYAASTDASGTFAVAASATASSLSVYCESDCMHFGTSSYSRLDLPPIDLSGGSVSNASLVWPISALSGTVTDIDGLPVANAEVSWNGAGFNGEDESKSDKRWTSNSYAMTNESGQFAFQVGPGTGSLQVVPGDESGLKPFALTPTITGDLTLALLVQFAPEALTFTVEAGDVVTSDPEGDGATSADPVETTLRAAAPGTVTIQELPVTQAAPPGVQFLTQQISITAPSGTPSNPLRIEFVLDSSRVPSGHDQNSIHMFRNGVLVIDCPGSSVAAPDPCVTRRESVHEGDVRIVVLTSAASEWNFGIVQGPVPSSCGEDSQCVDRDPCTIDQCAAGSCVHTRSTVEACERECEVDADCGDADSCTIDRCIANTCLFVPSNTPACRGTCEDEDCFDPLPYCADNPSSCECESDGCASVPDPTREPERDSGRKLFSCAVGPAGRSGDGLAVGLTLLVFALRRRQRAKRNR